MEVWTGSKDAALRDKDFRPGFGSRACQDLELARTTTSLPTSLPTYAVKYGQLLTIYIREDKNHTY